MLQQQGMNVHDEDDATNGDNKARYKSNDV